jgi:tryptophanyl-tRNA synthetase
MRANYEQLMADPGRIEDILRAGAEKARQLATPLMQELRQAVGLRSLRQAPGAGRAVATSVKTALPSLKQYRESDGKFYFKLVGGDGQVLVQSRGLDSPKQAGELASRLRRGDASVLEDGADCLEPVSAPQELLQALQALREATGAGPT